MVRLLVFLAAMALNHGSAAAQSPCQTRALRQLERLAPDGFAIYRQTRAKQDFLHWLTCADADLELTTAIHETVHLLTEEQDAYLLINGARLPRVPEGKSFFPPRILAAKFDPASTFVTTYLQTGAASSASEFRYLLDEFNAYAHDLHAAVALQTIASPDRDVYHRDGLAALMAFVTAYTEEARAHHPETWAELQKPAVKTAVVELWAQAERVMVSSCASPRFGFEAPQYLARVCASTARQGLGLMLGRPPVCPVRCREDRVSEQTGD